MLIQSSQGGPSGAVIAFKAPHIEVTVVDIDTARIAAWNSDELPVYEPQLKAIVETARDGVLGIRLPNLFFSTNVERAVKEADLVFLGVNTPTKQTGIGAGKASDLGWLEEATRRVGKASVHDTIVVEKSTVPCGTAATMRQILQATAKPGVRFEVLSNPEFLAEGTAVNNLLNPDRVLIGSRENEEGYEAARRLAEVYAAWVPTERIITMNLWSSELSKLASNALLAQRISSINALSALCEAVSANVDDVSFACGSDRRIGSRMMNASVGFGGSCFKKDVLNLVYIAESLGLPEVASYWQAVVDINEHQKQRFTRRIVQTMHNTVRNKRIAVLGFAYKKDTGDCRESAAITVVKGLLAEYAIVAIYDPKARPDSIWRELQLSQDSRSRVEICSSPYEACLGSHAVVILTEWDMFSNKSPDQRRRGVECLPSLSRPDSVADPTVLRERPASNCSDDIKLSWDRTSNVSSSDQDHDTNGIQTPQDSNQGENDDRGEVGDQGGEPTLDWHRVSQIMERPMFVFDGRNIVDADALMKLGFQVESIGKRAIHMDET